MSEALGLELDFLRLKRVAFEVANTLTSTSITTTITLNKSRKGFHIIGFMSMAEIVNGRGIVAKIRTELNLTFRRHISLSEVVK